MIGHTLRTHGAGYFDVLSICMHRNKMLEFRNHDVKCCSKYKYSISFPGYLELVQQHCFLQFPPNQFKSPDNHIYFIFEVIVEPLKVNNLCFQVFVFQCRRLSCSARRKNLETLSASHAEGVYDTLRHIRSLWLHHHKKRSRYHPCFSFLLVHFSFKYLVLSTKSKK